MNVKKHDDAGSLLTPAVSSLARVTLVLVGPPGEGKSTLGNLLASGVGSAQDGVLVPFVVVDSFESAGADLVHADFSFDGVNHRVVDTTGLLDGLPSAADRLATIASCAPGGIDAFVFVVRKGRFTDDIFDQLSAFEDAAGEGTLKRTVLVFTHCGRETNDQLIARCRRSNNAKLRETLQRVASVVGVESLVAGRNAGDRASVLACTAGVCRAHRDAPRLRPLDPAELRRELEEMDITVDGLSGERKNDLRSKLVGLRSGCASLHAVRQALNEARERQLAEERQAEDQRELETSVSQAQREAKLYRGAAQSLAKDDDDVIRSGGGMFSCCTPSSAACPGACADPCESCNDSTRELIQSWRAERQQEIQARFAEADATADRMK